MYETIPRSKTRGIENEKEEIILDPEIRKKHGMNLSKIRNEELQNEKG